MKGKSSEEIHSVVSGLSPQKKKKRLFSSVSDNDLITTELLLNSGVNVNTRSTDGSTVLLSACYLEYIDMINLLFKYGANPNVQDKDGWTPLMYAAQNNMENVVKMLLDHGADVNIKNKYGWTAPYIASHYREKDTVEIFKEYEKKKKELNESVRELMKEKSNDEILKGMTELSPDDILKKSVVNDYLFGVKKALELGAHPSDLIMWASEKGHTEIVKILLSDSRVDPSIEQNDPIRWASNNGHTEVVKLLLQDPRVDPSVMNNLPIKWASVHGRVDVVKLLLDDPRVDPSDSINEAIRLASHNGQTEIVKLLLQDERVRNKLSKDEIRKYENQINGLNESVRGLMKPKSDDELYQAVENREYPSELFKELLLKSLKEYNFIKMQQLSPAVCMFKFSVGETDFTVTSINQSVTMNVKHNGEQKVYTLPNNIEIFDTIIDRYKNI